MSRTSKHSDLLSAIGRVHALRVTGPDPLFLFDEILGHFLQLSQSEYGFIGEVIYTPLGEPHVKTQAITHLSWHEQEQERYLRHSTAGAEPETLAALFRSVLASAKPVIAQPVLPHSDRPGRHPQTIRSVLALPLHHGSKLIAMVGLANGKAGYDDKLLAYLNPLVGASASIIEGYQLDQRRLQVEAALRRSQEHFRSVTENALDLVSVLHRDGTVQYASPSHQRILGYGPAELVGKSFFEFVHPDDLPKGINVADFGSWATSDSSFVQFRFRHKEGSWRFLEGIGHDCGDDLVPRGIVVNARDITDRKRDAAELKQTLSLLSAALESTADGLLVVDRRERIVSFNRRFLDMWGLPESVLESREHSQVLNLTLGQLRDPQSARPKLAFLSEHAETESYDVLELEDGRVFERYSQPQRLAGISVGRVFSFRDITDRKRAEEALNAEAQISATLASVGQELIASLSTPQLLDRMCHLSAEALACDVTRTFLRRPESDVYVPVASHGDDAERWEVLRLLQLPQEVTAPLVGRLEQQAVVQLADIDDEGQVSLLQNLFEGLSSPLCVSLRRGKDVIGFLTAARRQAGQPFTPQQQRIAAGIAQLASLALENARLFQDLESANRLRSDFVAAMSHELRTPLHIIMGYTELLLEGEFGNLSPEQVNRLQRLADNAQALLELIQATLDISRINEGRLPVEIDEIHVPELLAELGQEQRELLSKPSVSFEWNVAPALPKLRSDPTKLKVVLKNLISNALKYTEQGKVTVTVTARDDGVLFSVCDTGIGIEPEAQAAIFEPFHRTDRSRTGGYSGAGLGLYIVGRLLAMLAGTITVDSEVGRGSTFTVWIPVDLDPEKSGRASRDSVTHMLPP